MLRGDDSRPVGPRLELDVRGYVGGAPVPLLVPFVKVQPVPVDSPAVLRLTARPAGTGRCRRPVPGRLAGYAVERTAARDVAAGELLDVDALERPWSVGDLVDVFPLTEPARRCGTCWVCWAGWAGELGAAVVDLVRRRRA